MKTLFTRCGKTLWCVCVCVCVPLFLLMCGYSWKFSLSHPVHICVQVFYDNLSKEMDLKAAVCTCCCVCVCVLP